jgi:hypothetical protein
MWKKNSPELSTAAVQVSSEILLTLIRILMDFSKLYLTFFPFYKSTLAAQHVSHARFTYLFKFASAKKNYVCNRFYNFGSRSERAIQYQATLVGYL